VGLEAVVPGGVDAGGGGGAADVVVCTVVEVDADVEVVGGCVVVVTSTGTSVGIEGVAAARGRACGLTSM